MKLRSSFVLAFALGVASTAQAQDKPEDLVKQRKAAFALMGKYMRPIVAMMKDKTPYDATVAARNAAFLEALAKMPWDGFQASTADVKDTKAKPELYKDRPKFDGYAKDLEAAVAKLAGATKGSDLAAVKAAFAEVGKNCKGCHEAFQRE